jgi:hypothetical protein
MYKYNFQLKCSELLAHALTACGLSNYTLSFNTQSQNVSLEEQKLNEI